MTKNEYVARTSRKKCRWWSEEINHSHRRNKLVIRYQASRKYCRSPRLKKVTTMPDSTMKDAPTIRRLQQKMLIKSKWINWFRQKWNEMSTGNANGPVAAKTNQIAQKLWMKWRWNRKRDKIEMHELCERVAAMCNKSAAEFFFSFFFF